MTPLFVLLFLIHIIVRLSPLILFLSMAHGMLAATFMDTLNSEPYSPRGDFGLCKCVTQVRATAIVTDVVVGWHHRTVYC